MIPRPSIAKDGFNLKCFELSKVKCRVHPIVVLTILDAYGRRDSGESSLVIGTLLGSVGDGATIEISDCFVDAFTWHEGDEQKALSLEKGLHEGMLSQKQKVAPQLQVVGCACTVPGVGALTAALNEWVHEERQVSKFVPIPGVLPEPIHLLIDATLQDHRMDVKAFARGPLQVIFRELPVEIYAPPAEKAAIGSLLQASGFTKSEMTTANELSPLSACSLEKLLKLTKQAEQYVQRVLDGKVEPDPEIGRMLMKALGAEPTLQGEKFEKIGQNAMQGNLAVAYLSGLATLQFTIAEKLNLSFA